MAVKVESVEDVYKLSRGIMKKEARKVNQYDLSGKFIVTHNSGKEAIQSLNREKPSTILGCCGYTRASAYGFIWRYADCPDKIGTEHSPKYNKKVTESATSEGVYWGGRGGRMNAS